MKNKCHLASLVHTAKKKRGRRNKAKYMKNVMYKQNGGFLALYLIAAYIAVVVVVKEIMTLDQGIELLILIVNQLIQ